MTPAVDIRNIRIGYGKHRIIDELSFHVDNGEFFIIIGPNGSGKTTLVKSIAGIIRASSGSIAIHGKPLSAYSSKSMAKTVAYVPQMAATDLPFTVMEVVLMGRSPHLGTLGIPAESDIDRARKALEFTGMDHLAHRKIDELSGGEQQRVFIARAVCQDTKIILLDEPTASLDLSHQVRIMDVMESLKKDRQVTVVMVSHDLNLAAMYGDRLLLLKKGTLADLGSPDRVMTYETLESVYGCPILVDKSPIDGCPRITLVPQRQLSPDQVLKSKASSGS